MYEFAEVWFRIARKSRPLKSIALDQKQLDVGTKQAVYSTDINGDDSLRLTNFQ
jgi:hypothetical protein